MPTRLISLKIIAARREPAPHLPPRPGYCLSAVFAAVARLCVATCAGIARLVDACMHKMRRDHAALVGEDRISITSAPAVPDHG